MPPGGLAYIEETLLESDLFTAIINNEYATVFVLTEDLDKIPEIGTSE